MDVQDFAPPQIVQVPQSNILILGPVGAGKSSFFNTIASVFRGHVTGQASSGNAEHSITSKVNISSLWKDICITFVMQSIVRLSCTYSVVALFKETKSSTMNIFRNFLFSF